MGKMKEVLSKITKKHMICGVLAVMAVVIGAVVGAMLYRNSETPAKAGELPKEMFEVKSVLEEVVDLQKLKTPEDTPTIRTISFSGISIEKDLKVRIVDETDTLVTGTAFRIIVRPEGKEDNRQEYIDEDMDGIIHIKDMNGGNYVVELQEQEGFTILENAIVVKVKDKIEYVQVDIKTEIKQDKDVDASEDAGNNKAPVKNPIENTLPLLESTITTTKVEKEQISTENFTSASVSQTVHEVSAGATRILIPESVTLYSVGTEHAKTCKVNLELITDETRAVSLQHIEWSVDNPSIVSLTKNSNTEALVSAAENGKTVIVLTILYLDENGQSQAASQQITVEVSNFTDSQTKLLDMKGNVLYLDSKAKTVATLKDYGTTSVFYSSPKYTGWQTIDGKSYYFKADNQPAKGEQTIGNFHYVFDNDGVLIDSKEQKGIDVSKWNGAIDWKTVASAGIDFAIIRVGYRGIQTGVIVEDPYFKENIAGAAKHGIEVGVYFYSQALTEAEAVEEASMAIQLVKGYKLDYPIFIDTEGSGGVADSLSKSARTKIAKAFCETVRSAGYKPGVYANEWWFNNRVDTSQFEAYMIWVAQYNSKCTYKGRYEMWQYSETGKVSGVKGYVDLNICYKRY